MVIDIALVVISILVIVFSIKKGFITSVFGLVAWVLSVLIILKISMPISEALFDGFVREKIVHNISEKLTEDYAYGTAQSQFSAFVASTSKIIDSTSSLLNINLTTGLDTLNPENMTADKVAEVITDRYLSTIILYFIKWIVSVVGFVLLVLAFTYIGRLITRVIRATPFKKADRALGGVVGVIKAFVIVLVVSALLQISTGLIFSNNAIKELSKPEYQTKESNYVKMVNESKIVEFMNEHSPINERLYKW